MTAKREMPVGEQSFQNLRNDGCVYVDKTRYIYNIITQGRAYFLSRPRRFGKSLLLSTIEAYFLGKKELFKGLYLEHAELELAAEEERQAWQEYPVLYLDLSDNNNKIPGTLDINLNDQLTGWEKRYGTEPTELDFATRFRGIIRRAYEKEGRQVVLLIDEYDKPLLETLGIPELHSKTKETLHGFYSVIKGSSKYLRLVFFTGVTRFAKMGLFSGLNNLKDLSMLPNYSGLCGITEKELLENFAPEIKSFATQYELSHDQALAFLKKRYDGYLFSERGENVYNPFSLLSVFSEDYMNDYWYGSGTPTFLVEKLKRERHHIPSFEKGILIPKRVVENYNTDSMDILPVLFQAGYLTIKGYQAKKELYLFGFPNEEVKYSFLINLQPILAPYPKSVTGTAVWEFYEAIETGNVKKMMEKIEALITAVPYDNINDVEYRERDAQIALFFIFTLLGEYTATEVHNNKGRADLIVHTDEVIYIFELKLWSAGTPDDAIAQIKTQGYATPYQASNKKILLIGASFDQEKRNLGEWKVEELMPPQPLRS
ncbi:MAG: AAA family ATPase [Bacteroides sp.]